MVTGGTPARPRIVLSLSVGGAVVASVVLGGQCCTPPPEPAPPPAPTVIVDVVEPPADAGEDVAPARCEYTVPRARAERRRAPRIVGGNPAQDGAFPFTVAVATPDRRHYCGASVVRDTWVVSAAHCMIGVGDLVLVGSNSLTDARAVRVAESRLHPAYNPTTFDNDVAVARLAEPAGVHALPLAEGITSEDAVAVGWGKTCETCSTTNFLREVALPLWSNSACQQAYPSLTERQICAAPVTGGMDACAGDSGSGLLTWAVDHWELLGITSYGLGCARPGFPGVWARVIHPGIRTWITACTSD